MVGSWPDRRHDLDLYDLLPNPNKFDECDPDLMLNTPCSEYYSVRSFNKMLVNSDAKSFSILHCNIRSLSKNLNLLEELLCSLDSKLDILGITETKLGEKSISNVNIKGYNFFHTDSPTNAGGAALYIANNLKAVPRPDIKFDVALVESCWAEIDAGEGKKKIIIGCIYKHPTCNLEQFRNQLNDIIKTINPNRHEIYIFGDMNINFLKFNEHAQTEEFLDMVYANNILPIITKPTSPTPYFTLLEILKLENIFKLKIGALVHRIQYQKTDKPHVLYDLVQPALAVHNYNTRYATNQNPCRPFSRTNYGLARFSVVASQTWEATPTKIKCLPLNSFKKEYKLFLLDSQAS